MKLFHLVRVSGAMDGQLDSCVVVARVEHEARQLAHENETSTRARLGYSTTVADFLDSELVRCTELVPNEQPRVVCADFYEP